MTITAERVVAALKDQGVGSLVGDGEINPEQLADYLNTGGDDVGNPVHVELPGTEATLLYDDDVHALYIKLREDPTGLIETHTVLDNPVVNIDVREGEAVGIEILFAKKDG